MGLREEAMAVLLDSDEVQRLLTETGLGVEHLKIIVDMTAKQQLITTKMKLLVLYPMAVNVQQVLNGDDPAQAQHRIEALRQWLVHWDTELARDYGAS